MKLILKNKSKPKLILKKKKPVKGTKTLKTKKSYIAKNNSLKT